MTTQTKSQSPTHGWLDSLAIGLSVICAIHCIVTPVLVAVLPVVASTFWVHKDFHLWMLLLVVPMATLSLFLGCKKHKSRLVMMWGLLGLGVLASVALYESLFHSTLVLQEHVHCVHCTLRQSGSLLNSTNLANVVGAIFLTSAHARNFLLCRKANCCHE